VITFGSVNILFRGNGVIRCVITLPQGFTIEVFRYLLWRRIFREDYLDWGEPCAGTLERWRIHESASHHLLHQDWNDRRCSSGYTRDHPWSNTDEEGCRRSPRWCQWVRARLWVIETVRAIDTKPSLVVA